MVENISLEVLGERLANTLAGVADIRTNMVVKEVYRGDMESLRTAISDERVDRVKDQADLKGELLEKISAVQEQVTTNKKVSDATATALTTRKLTLQNGIIIGSVVAAGSGLVAVLVALVQSAAHLGA